MRLLILTPCQNVRRKKGSSRMLIRCWHGVCCRCCCFSMKIRVRPRRRRLITLPRLSIQETASSNHSRNTVCIHACFATNCVDVYFLGKSDFFLNLRNVISLVLKRELLLCAIHTTKCNQQIHRINTKAVSNLVCSNIIIDRRHWKNRKTALKGACEWNRM